MINEPVIDEAAQDAAGTARPAVRTGRWQLPTRRAATTHARRAIHDALRRWGLGQAAGDLADRLTPLIQDLIIRTTAHGHCPRGGPIDLRLELRVAERLLLGEIHEPAPRAPTLGDPASTRPGRRAIVALTYGHRLSPDRAGTRYTHAFTWHSDEIEPPHPSGDGGKRCGEQDGDAGYR